MHSLNRVGLSRRPIVRTFFISGVCHYARKSANCVAEKKLSFEVELEKSGNAGDCVFVALEPAGEGPVLDRIPGQEDDPPRVIADSGIDL